MGLCLVSALSGKAGRAHGDPALKDMDELAVTQQIVVFRGRPLRPGAFLGTAVQGFEDEGCGRPVAFFAELGVVSGESRVEAGGGGSLCGAACGRAQRRGDGRRGRGRRGGGARARSLGGGVSRASGGRVAE